MTRPAAMTRTTERTRERDMYTVIKNFEDLQDKRHKYSAGDIYPRKGLAVSEERIAELAGSNNRQGTPLIAPAEPKEKPRRQRSKK